MDGEDLLENIPPPPDPPDPDECCGSGCTRCVYDLYEIQLEKYNQMKDKLLEKNKSILKRREIEGEREREREREGKGDKETELRVFNTLSLKDNKQLVNDVDASSEDVEIIYLKDDDHDAKSYKGYINEKIMHYGTISQNSKRLTSQESPEQVYHMEIETNKPINYEPGDYINILCPQDPEMVDKLLKKLNLKDNQIISIKQLPCSTSLSSTQLPLPSIISVKDLFTWKLNISFIPPQFFLHQMADFCTNKNDKEKLNYLSSSAGTTLYNETIVQHHIGFPTLWNKFKSFKPTLEFLLLNIPSHTMRQYSLANSPFQHTDENNNNVVHITFKLVTKSTTSIHYGQCTYWMYRMINSLDNNDNSDGNNKLIVPFEINRSPDFKLPDDLSIPLILISTGTGLAPFRAFLQHRCHLIRSNQLSDTSTDIGPCLLFFGCRRKDWDLLYHDELLEFEKDKTITKLFISYSNPVDPPLTKSTEGRRYINYHIEENGQLLYDLVSNKSGIIYICGSSEGIGKSAVESLLKIIKRYSNSTNESEVLDQWKDNNQFKIDIYN